MKDCWHDLFYLVERLGARSWQRFKYPRLLIGLLNKVQLCLFSRLTKERCIALYLFAQWLYQHRKKAGWLLNVSLYIQSANTCLMRYYGGKFDRHLAVPFPVSLTRTGLPVELPTTGEAYRLN